MENQKTDEQILRESAENAVFLVEGWQNLGDIEGKKIYRGQVGPWTILVRSNPDTGSESCVVEAQAQEREANLTVNFSPSFARTTLRRAMKDESERALRAVHPLPRRKKGFKTARGRR